MAQVAREAAHEQAKEDVARIVDTQIDAGIGAETGPNEQQQGEAAMTDEQGKKDTEAKSVGGMTGDETVTAASITIDNVDQIHDRGVLRRTETLEQRFADARSHLVAYENGKSNGKESGQKVTGSASASNDVQQHGKHWHRHPCGSDKHHHLIPKKGMATIQLQKQRLVEGDYLLQEGVHFSFVCYSLLFQIFMLSLSC